MVVTLASLSSDSQLNSVGESGSETITTCVKHTVDSFKLSKCLKFCTLMTRYTAIMLSSRSINCRASGNLT